MIPWVQLDRDDAAGLRLMQRGQEFSIRVGVAELMNSRIHGSEEELARRACAVIAGRPAARILIGGLGMGFTLRAALDVLGPKAAVVVAELSPVVVRWNRGPLAALSGDSVADKRVTIREADVAALIQAERGGFDAILLDVDNGPDAMVRDSNAWLYGYAGLAAAQAALRPGGVLAVWSAAPDRDFAHRLEQSGYEVDEARVPARGARGGARHVIWVATRPMGPRVKPAGDSSKKSGNQGRSRGRGR